MSILILVIPRCCFSLNHYPRILIFSISFVKFDLINDRLDLVSIIFFILSLYFLLFSPTITNWSTNGNSLTSTTSSLPTIEIFTSSKKSVE